MSSPEISAVLLAHAVPIFNERYPSREGLVVSSFAPGRVNLIGDHTDYNEGFVFPMALDSGTLVIGAKRESGQGCSIYSESMGEELSCSLADQSRWREKDQMTWSKYVLGGLAKFAEASGLASDFSFCAVISNNLPIGGGLSSSASLVLAFFTFLEELCDKRFDPKEKAMMCHFAEREYAGVPCGIMDQFIVSLGKSRHGLLLDCRSREATQVPMPSEGATVLVTNSMVSHELSSSQYSVRVAQCADAVEAIGKHSAKQRKSLREVEIDEAEAAFTAGAMNEVTWKRARHVITENARTQKAVAALQSKNIQELGKLMFESHTSLKDDYEVSCPELDKLVGMAKELEGVYGCRMTGGGFGGCVVSLVAPDHVAQVQEMLSAKYKEAVGKDCVHVVSAGGAGARRVDVALHYPQQHAAECIIRARLLKEEGNKLLAQGQVKAALDKYHRIHFYVGGLAKPTNAKGNGMGGLGGLMPSNKDQTALTASEQEEITREVRAAIDGCTCKTVLQLVRGMHLNKALCYTKLDAWEKGVTAVDKALEYGADEGKCMYRRGMCNMKLGDADKARRDLSRALQINKDDSAVVKALKDLDKLDKAQDVKAKKAFQKMFS